MFTVVILSSTTSACYKGILIENRLDSRQALLCYNFILITIICEIIFNFNIFISEVTSVLTLNYHLTRVSSMVFPVLQRVRVLGILILTRSD